MPGDAYTRWRALAPAPLLYFLAVFGAKGLCRSRRPFDPSALINYGKLHEPYMRAADVLSATASTYFGLIYTFQRGTITLSSYV
ncbi:hypothetical protein DFH11DRAFT_1639832 [Phellopilus nigrolimitatus]|nr:hypothetical protein DFH11DRAFT_1639832 [Phellopilus nigrolimitatus]